VAVGPVGRTCVQALSKHLFFASKSKKWKSFVNVHNCFDHLFFSLLGFRWRPNTNFAYVSRNKIFLCVQRLLFSCGFKFQGEQTLLYILVAAPVNFTVSLVNFFANTANSVKLANLRVFFTSFNS